MPDFIKDNWFVVIIAVIIISFVGYFIYDGNRYNVSKKSVDGQQAIASVGDDYITADDFYNQEKDFDAVIIYNLYHNAVVEQSVETTKDLKDEAKNMESIIRTNFQNQYGDSYEVSLQSELSSYGFTGEDALYDYCLMSMKEKQMNREYVTDNFDSLKEKVEAKNPRTISIITMAVGDANNLTDDEKSKQASIDKEIKDGSFEKAATAFSEDTATAPKKGFYGYIDQNDTSLDTAVSEAALKVKKGQESDWITVVDPNSGATTLYKVHVDETDLETLFKSDDEAVRDAVLYAFIKNNDSLDIKIVEFYASKLDVDIKDEDTKKKLESYIQSLKEGEA